MQGKFRPDEQSIREILSKRIPYVVPLFQREYSWETDKIDAFWDDMILNHHKVDATTTFAAEDNEYYFGAMVFVRAPQQDDITLVDGQQRFATVTTFLSAVRDILFEIKSSDTTEEIKLVATSSETFVSAFIEEKTDEGEFRFWKLDLNVRNKDFFRKIQKIGLPVDKISELKAIRRKSKSEKNLENAYNELSKKISEYKNQFSLEEQPSKLRSLVSRMTEWFSIISIGVTSEEDAFNIFESLNERGEPLIIGDLVKNMLMQKVRESERNGLDTIWGEIMTNLKGVENKVDQFLTYSWYSRRFFSHEKVSKKDLFKKIKVNIPDESAVLSYANILHEDSEVFAALVDPMNHPSFWDDEDTMHYLSSLSSLKAERTMPALMTAYRKFGSDKNSFREFSRVLLSFFFRFKTFQNESADKVLEKMVHMSSYLSGLDPTQNPPSTCEPWTLNDVKNNLRKSVDSDEKFKLEFETWSTESSTTAKYVLYELENIYAHQRNGELKPLANLTWEHILPQKHSEHWGDFEHADSFVNRLGNMTILKAKINREIQNKKFSEKKSIAYSQSALKINSETVNNQTEWTSTIINERQEEFAKKSLDIWNF